MVDGNVPALELLRAEYTKFESATAKKIDDLGKWIRTRSKMISAPLLRLGVSPGFLAALFSVCGALVVYVQNAESMMAQMRGFRGLERSGTHKVVMFQSRSGPPGESSHGSYQACSVV